MCENQTYNKIEGAKITTKNGQSINIKRVMLTGIFRVMINNQFKESFDTIFY